jgi:hypothetical protein
VHVQPGLLRYLEVCGENVDGRDDKRRDRQPMREEENAAPVDPERRNIGAQKSQSVDPPRRL